MTNKLILTGDVNLMMSPMRRSLFGMLRPSSTRPTSFFSNLECCLHLSDATHSHEGFFADPIAGGEAAAAFRLSGPWHRNNVNYGAANIAGPSIARLTARHSAHRSRSPIRGSAAHRPSSIAWVACGVVQRSSVYWPTITRP